MEDSVATEMWPERQYGPESQDASRGHVVHFLTELASVPLCSSSDIANVRRGYIGFALDGGLTVPEENAGAYAWDRMPRFLDNRKAVREAFKERYPGEVRVHIDLGSSFPKYKGICKAIDLRKYGDATREAVGSFAHGMVVELAGHEASKGDPLIKAIFEELTKKASIARLALISNIQLALATVPIELSGDLKAIEEYVFTVSSFLNVFAAKRIQTGNERRKNQTGSPAIDKNTATMEERWRIDTTIAENPDGLSVLGMLSSLEVKALGPESKALVKEAFRQSHLAGRSGDEARAKKLRAEAEEFRDSESLTLQPGEGLSWAVLRELSGRVIRHLVQSGEASPAQYFSIDMADPKKLVEYALKSHDHRTLSTGLFRREAEDLLRGSKSHITGDVDKALNEFRNGSVMLFTSFEAEFFYRELPSDVRELSESVDRVTATIKKIIRKLHIGGAYVCFPWDVVTTTEEENAKNLHRSDPHSRKLALIRRRYLERISKNISDLGVGELEIKHYTLEQLFEWMSPEELEFLVPFSPIFRNYVGKDPKTTTIPLMTFTKTAFLP